MPLRMFKAIFFDAAGTLIYLTKTVGDHYALVGQEIGLKLDATKLDRAFYCRLETNAAASAHRRPARK